MKYSFTTLTIAIMMPLSLLAQHDGYTHRTSVQVPYADGNIASIVDEEQTSIPDEISAKAKIWKECRQMKKAAGRNAATRAAKTFKIGNGTQYPDINAAMDANAIDDGDILEVQAGTVMQEDQNIYKSVTIKGPGWTMDPSVPWPNANAVQLLGHVYLNAEDIRLTGMLLDNKPAGENSYTSSYIYLMEDGAVIDHCHIKSTINVRNADYRVENVVLKQNFIAATIGGRKSECNQNWSIQNNIIAPGASSSGGEYNVISNLSSAKIDHNIIYSQLTTSGYCLKANDHCTITNNVIVHFPYTVVSLEAKGTGEGLVAENTSSTFSHNVFTGSVPFTNNKGGITARTDIFDFSTSYFYFSKDYSYRIKAGSLASGYATDGTDCGPWSGIEHYEGGSGEGGTPEPVTPMSGDNYHLDGKHNDGKEGTEYYYRTLQSLFTDIDTRGVSSSGVRISAVPYILKATLTTSTYTFAITVQTLPLLQSLWQKRQTFVNLNNNKLISMWANESDDIRLNFTAQAGSGITIDVVHSYVKELMSFINLYNITVLFNGEPLFEEPKQPVTDGMYKVTLPESPVKYNGHSHPAKVTVADGVGTPTLYYKRTSGGSSAMTTDAPVEVGKYEVYLEIAEGAKYLAMECTLVGVIEIVSGTLLGDANTDGEVNVLDAQWTLRYILAPGQTTPFSFENANTFAKDQVINVQDIVCTVNIFMGRSLAEAKRGLDGGNSGGSPSEKRWAR